MYTNILQVAAFAISSFAFCKIPQKTITSPHRSIDSTFTMPSSIENIVLECTYDAYGGVIVNASRLPQSSVKFTRMLSASIHQWRNEGVRGVWLKIPKHFVDFIPIASGAGFDFHHAQEEYVMMTTWLPKTPSTLPPHTSHQLGVGAVVHKDGKILAVQEKTGPLRGKDVWKVPTGLVDKGEEIDAAAIREVFEETGIRAKFVGVVAIRHLHGLQNGKSDMFFHCLLEPLTTEITHQETEIEKAEWIPFDQFFSQDFNYRNEFYQYFNEVTKAAVSGSLESFIMPVPPSVYGGKPVVYVSDKPPAINKECP
jgi:ADP-ribose pyrophosphatase YjhB (NUDIX family)